MGELNFGVPLDSYDRISSPYGDRIHPITKKRKFHSGIDYKVDTGTSVRASERGRVVRASDHEKLGKLIIIDHTPNAGKGTRYLYTMYAHLSGYEVAAGDDVKKGNAIGRSGNTGHSTGPHLHFSIVESSTKQRWGTAGPTGYEPTPSLFKNPEGYYGRTITVEGMVDDFTDEEKGKLYDMIETDFRIEPKPRLSLRVPRFQEYLRKIGRKSYLWTPPKVNLRFENNFGKEFRSLFPSLELEVNGRSLGRIQTGAKSYELDLWR
jgi:murein DD-endopeptidase MepM/ murein hydrolase activator NlpD